MLLEIRGGRRRHRDSASVPAHRLLESAPYEQRAEHRRGTHGAERDGAHGQRTVVAPGAGSLRLGPGRSGLVNPAAARTVRRGRRGAVVRGVLLGGPRRRRNVLRHLGRRRWDRLLLSGWLLNRRLLGRWLLGRWLLGR